MQESYSPNHTGGIHALQGCLVSVEQGLLPGVIGPNGSAKTRLFHVITGYERPDAGSVLFDRRSITGATPEQVWCLGIGRTFQLTRIFPRLTVLENMHVAFRREGVRGQQAFPEGNSAWSSLRAA